MLVVSKGVREAYGILLNRQDTAVMVLGYKHPRSLYQTFNPVELDEIECEALEQRRKKCSRQVANVYAALYKEAIAGNVQAFAKSSWIGQKAR